MYSCGSGNTWKIQQIELVFNNAVGGANSYRVNSGKIS